MHDGATWPLNGTAQKVAVAAKVVAPVQINAWFCMVMQFLKIHEIHETDAELIDMLEQRLVSTRESSLETVRQLEQQLEDAQLCAQEKIADMEKQLQEARSRSQADLSVLQERKKEALCSRDGEIEELKQQAEAARRQSANACAALHQQQQTLRARQDEEEKKLQTMKQDIEVRRSQGVANVTKELKHVMEQTREILKATEATPPDTGVKQHRDWPADNSAAADSSTAEVIR